MAPTIKHKFISPKLPGPDPTIVSPVNWNDEHALLGSGWIVPGMIIDYVGHSVPTGFLEAYGQSVAAATYPNLFAAMVKQSTVTFTAGTPGVVNWDNHGLPINGKVRFRSSGGALPTEITANTDYFIVSGGYTASSFRISTIVGGAEIALATGGTGTQTGINSQFGVSTDLTTFTVPDLRGYVLAGLDNMGGTAANRLTGLSGGVSGSVLGAVGGSQGHTLVVGEIAEHTHLNDPPDPTVSLVGLTVTLGAAGGHTHTNTLVITGASIGAAGGHTHSFSGQSGNDAPDHANLINGRIYGATYNAGAHSHSIIDSSGNAFEQSDAIMQGGGGGRRWVQRGDQAGGTGDILVAQNGGPHEHSVYVDANFWSGGANTRHQHPFGFTVSTADHTHPLVGGTIGGTINAVADHTHTAVASGTAASAQADYNSGSSGGGAAHNNVQPTAVVRKLIYVA